MPLTSAERSAAHRAGQSSPMAKRVGLAARSAVSDPGEQRIFKSELPGIAGALTIADKAYFVYVGKSAAPVQLNYVEFAVTTSAVGTQAAEIGIFSSPLAPNKAAQTLTCLAVATSLTDLTAAAGVNRNSTALAYTVPDSGIHLWAGFRVNMTTGPTQPQIWGLTGDFAEGAILSMSTAGVLAVGTTYAGAIITHAVTWQAPDLRITID